MNNNFSDFFDHLVSMTERYAQHEEKINILMALGATQEDINNIYTQSIESLFTIDWWLDRAIERAKRGLKPIAVDYMATETQKPAMIEWKLVWICGYDKNKKEPCHATLRCFIDAHKPQELHNIIEQITRDCGWIFVSSQNITNGTNPYYGILSS